jgi:putative toxin-antitoxin system antitoxin component (TIGR02293 family)
MTVKGDVAPSPSKKKLGSSVKIDITSGVSQEVNESFVEWRKPLKGKTSVGVLVYTRDSSSMTNKSNWRVIVSQTIDLSGVDRHNLIQSGLQTTILKDLLGSFQRVPKHTLLNAIGLSTKTLSRRVDFRLGPRHSDAAMALIEVTDTAQRVLGNRQLAEEWLTKPALALDGMRPLDLISTTPGIEAVKDLLTRMEYGVYA